MSFPRYPEYKDSGVEWLGEVPAHWEVKPIKAIASCNDDVLDESTPGDREIQYVEISGVAEGKITEVTRVAFGDAPSRARRRVQNGDVLVSTVRTYLRAIAAVEQPPANMIASTGFAVVRPRLVSPAYLRHLFLAEYLIAGVIARSVGVSYPAINPSELMRLEVPVPPPAEQEALAAFLDRETAKIDALIVEQERLIELLKEKRQAVISHAVTKGLDPDLPMKDSGLEWLGKVPAHWSVRPLWSLSSVVRGASPRPAGDSRFFHGDHTPWVTVAEITKDASPDLTETSELLTAEGASMSRLFRAGTIIYSNSGATLGVPKRLCIDACANDGVVGFENLSNKLLAMFLYHYLGALTSTMREMVKQGAGQPNLNTDIVKAVRIPLPTVAEQERICAHVENMSNLFETLMADIWRSVTLLRQRRAALITSAIAGQIDCRGLDVATAHAACVEFD